MPFVKLDVRILDSTLWTDTDASRLFVTALLMAVPITIDKPSEAVALDSCNFTGYKVPQGNYGMIHAPSVGIINRAGMEREVGMAALLRLTQPEHESRSQEFEGRRLIRVDGGFLVLNYAKYRDKDETSAERQRRWRAKQKLKAEAIPPESNGVTSRHVTQAEEQGGAEADAIKKPLSKAALLDESRLAELKAGYPKRVGSQPWKKAMKAAHARMASHTTWPEIIDGVRRYAEFCRSQGKTDTEFVMMAATFCGPDEHFKEPWTCPLAEEAAAAHRTEILALGKMLGITHSEAEQWDAFESHVLAANEKRLEAI